MRLTTDITDRDYSYSYYIVRGENYKNDGCSCKMNMEHAWNNGFYKGKRIAQYKDGKLIAIYDNVMQASRSIGSKTNGQNIGKVALGKRKHAFGFEWKYI